jgi:hypothetical protein
MEYTEGYNKKPNKLALNFKGPYKIVNINQDRYTLLNLLNDKTNHLWSLHITHDAINYLDGGGLTTFGRYTSHMMQ